MTGILLFEGYETLDVHGPVEFLGKKVIAAILHFAVILFEGFRPI